MTAWPALSSDARLIAFVSDGGVDGAPPQIWVQQVGGSGLRLTSGEREYSYLSFSPDDTRIVFTAADGAGQHVYEIPTLGGEPRLLQRDAKCGEVSPDAKWLACVSRDGMAIRIAARGGAGYRTIAAQLVDVSCITWTGESRSVVVHARPGATAEPDWWIVPVDGGPPINTGVTRAFRDAGMFSLPTGVAWVENSLVFAAAGSRGKGVYLYRQRVNPVTYQPVGLPEQLTSGSELTSLPRAAGQRLAFLSSRADMNLWSVTVDAGSGTAVGPLQSHDTRTGSSRLLVSHTRFSNTRILFVPTRAW
jgi:hypothetical protein